MFSKEYCLLEIQVYKGMFLFLESFQTLKDRDVWQKCSLIAGHASVFQEGPHFSLSILQLLHD